MQLVIGVGLHSSAIEEALAPLHEECVFAVQEKPVFCTLSFTFKLSEAQKCDCNSSESEFCTLSFTSEVSQALVLPCTSLCECISGEVRICSLSFASKMSQVVCGHLGHILIWWCHRVWFSVSVQAWNTILKERIWTIRVNARLCFLLFIGTLALRYTLRVSLQFRGVQFASRTPPARCQCWNAGRSGNFLLTWSRRAFRR